MRETIIQPKRALDIGVFKELWEFRELFLSFSMRDIKVRYKQAIIGIAWAILQPLLLALIFFFFFGRSTNTHIIEGTPYIIFSLVGLIFWSFFSNALSSSSRVLVENKDMLQKIYFPRLILPLSSVIARLVDFIFSFVVFIFALLYFRVDISFVDLFYFIPSLVVCFIAASGIGILLSSINVKYRDVQHALPFFIQLILFVTPIIYPSTAAGKYQSLWAYNPLAGAIEFVRAGLLGIGTLSWTSLFLSFAMSLSVFLLGLFVFSRNERYFADII